MNPYGHTAQQIADELTQLRREKALAEYTAKAESDLELWLNMRGHDGDIRRLRARRAKHNADIMRRRAMAEFTEQRMLVGERIIRELEQNGGTIWH